MKKAPEKIALLMEEEDRSEPKAASDGWQDNIETATKGNEDYRRVEFTSEYLQLVYMNLEPGDEIGEEVHDDGDQFIRVDSGNGKSVVNGKEKDFGDGDAVIIPAGTKHNIINTGDTPLKLYTVYGPPRHLKDTVQANKSDDAEDHFDGETDV